MKLRVSEIAKKQGYTLQDIADKINISRQSLANTLSKGNPTLETLERISIALDVNVSDLLVEERKSTLSCPKCGARLELREVE